MPILSSLQKLFLLILLVTCNLNASICTSPSADLCKLNAGSAASIDKFSVCKAITNGSANAIMIPSGAVIPDDRATKIVIADSSKAKFVNIEIGVRTASEVQVLSGLKPGDTVLTTGLLQVKPGMPVKFTKTTSRSTIK